MLKQIIDTNVAEHPEGAVYLGSSTLTEESNFFVRRAGEDRWDIAHVRAPGDQDREPAVDTSALLERLARLSALPAEEA